MSNSVVVLPALHALLKKAISSLEFNWKLSQKHRFFHWIGTDETCEVKLKLKTLHESTRIFQKKLNKKIKPDMQHCRLL